jgi:hypothetical protein
LSVHLNPLCGLQLPRWPNLFEAFIGNQWLRVIFAWKKNLALSDP